MKLATLRLKDGNTAAALVEGGEYVEIPGVADVGALLGLEDWREIARAADGSRHSGAEVSLGTVVPSPSKVICVGLNYAAHIEEMGRDLPVHPTLFAKFADTLTGPYDEIESVNEDSQMDWEGELAIIVGSECRRVSETEAGDVIAGYTIANDISMREWQARTSEWLQGKIWSRSTPVGPVMLTADEFDRKEAMIRTSVNGKIMQEHSTDDLVFTPEYLVSYISTMIPLRPGDMILTGTPGGVGKARDPQIFLNPGDEVEVEIDDIGSIRSGIVEPS